MAKWTLAKGMTWRMKLEEVHPNHGKLVDTPLSLQKRYGEGKMLIPRPLDVEAAIHTIPEGELTTPARLREKLAADAGANSACPFSTGIFVRMVAEAADEDRLAGKEPIAPYWRIVRDDGKLNDKLPGGVLAQAAMLEQEGLTILEGKGKQPPRVEDHESRIVSW